MPLTWLDIRKDHMVSSKHHLGNLQNSMETFRRLQKSEENWKIDIKTVHVHKYGNNNNNTIISINFLLMLHASN